jgi:2-polyprenyl-3-methyl-5-hydroxy-6-metoxy-1,4-benzoquinol methylase
MTALAEEFAQLNRLVADYDDSPFDRAMRHYMLRSLDPFLPAGKALEMGCLYGEFTSLLAERYADLTVVDAAAEFLDVTRRRVGEGPQYHQAMFEDFEPVEHYDAIFLMHVLEHLVDPVGVLKRAAGWLTPNGRLFVVVPNGNAVSRQIAVKMGVLPHRGALSAADVKHGHRRTYFLDTLQRDALDAGLTIQHSGGVFFKPLANFQLDALMGGSLISDAFMEGCYQLGKEHPDGCASIFLVCSA